VCQVFSLTLLKWGGNSPRGTPGPASHRGLHVSPVRVGLHQCTCLRYGRRHATHGTPWHDTLAPCFVFCVRRLLSAMPYKQGGGRAACCLCRETRGAILGAVKRRGTHAALLNVRLATSRGGTRTRVVLLKIADRGMEGPCMSTQARADRHIPSLTPAPAQHTQDGKLDKVPCAVFQSAPCPCHGASCAPCSWRPPGVILFPASSARPAGSAAWQRSQLPSRPARL